MSEIQRPIRSERPSKSRRLRRMRRGKLLWQVTTLVALCVAVCVGALAGCGVSDELMLEVSTALLPADGKREVTFRVRGRNALGRQIDVTERSTILIEGEGAENRDEAAWKERKFRTQTIGTYTFRAKHGDLVTAPVKVEALGERAFVYKTLRDIYFWSDKVPEQDLSSFGSPQEILQKLRYDSAKGGQDRWSYIANLQSHTNFDTKGQYVGVGFSVAYDTEGKLRVSLAHPDSPAGRAGVVRGLEVMEINGKTIKQIEEERLWGTIFGKPEAGVAVALKVMMKETAKDISFEKGAIQVKSVFTTRIVEAAGKKVGYLLFNQFIEPSISELDAAFKEFREQGVEELVLDLRYNGGGRLSTAHHLGALLMGKDASDKIFFQYVHNEKYKEWNQEVRFKRSVEQAMDLKRVYIIAMGGSASASEVLINGLKPHLPVTVIGRNTHGKPMGMYVFNFFDKVLAPISFKLANSEGKGEFFDGIKPDIPAIDDVTHRFGDPQEQAFKVALEAIADPNKQRQPLSLPQPSKAVPMKGLRRLIGAF